MIEKFGADSLEELLLNYTSFLKAARALPRE